MSSSSVSAEALLQPVAVETVELQHVNIKGGKQSVSFVPSTENGAKAGFISGLALKKEKQDC